MAHQDGVIESTAKLVLELNSIVNTECGSNAIAEHLGHMSNLITQSQRERLHPFQASNEMLIRYTMPDMPDVIELGVHKRLSKLWLKVGGRNPLGNPQSRRLKKMGILTKKEVMPVPKHNKKTIYYRKKLHKYLSNVKKVVFLKACFNKS